MVVRGIIVQSSLPANPSRLLTSADAVRLLEPHCTEPFFSPEAYAHIVTVAEWFPVEMSLSHMFERPLTGADQPVDFFLYLRAPELREALANQMPRELLALESWQRIRELARGWIDPSSPMRDIVSVWLEFDIRGVPRGTPESLIFVTIGRSTPITPIARVLGASSFEAAWNAIPDSCRYRTIGVLYARETRTVRMIHIMTPADALAYLETIAWPGSIDELRAQYAPFLRFAPEIALHVDVTPEGISPQVGMEIYPNRRALFLGEPADPRPLLDAAVAESLCAPGQRDALVAWPGEEIVDGIRATRKVHHIKVVRRADATLFAKAYTTAEYEVL